MIAQKLEEKNIEICFQTTFTWFLSTPLNYENSFIKLFIELVY